MYGFAKVGTCLAFFVKSKNQGVRSTSIGAMLSQLFGISEPVLFGIQLRYNLRPLLIMLFTSGLGAALLSVLGIQSNSYGLAVLPSYLMYIYKGSQLLWYFIISVCSVACCFVLTCLFGIPKEVLEEDGEEAASGTTMQKTMPEITSPATGTLVPLNEVGDEVFANKVLGDGFAIDITDGRILAPVDGTVAAAFDTGHAVGIRTEDGREILVHIGINTVELGGQGFCLLVEQGQTVKRGDLMVEVDMDYVKGKGKDLTTMVLFTSGEAVVIKKHGKVTAGEGLECLMNG
jgi:PTS system sucrose-specific IIC component